MFLSLEVWHVAALETKWTDRRIGQPLKGEGLDYLEQSISSSADGSQYSYTNSSIDVMYFLKVIFYEDWVFQKLFSVLIR
jgi:hypothetical protein